MRRSALVLALVLGSVGLVGDAGAREAAPPGEPAVAVEGAQAASGPRTVEEALTRIDPRDVSSWLDGVARATRMVSGLEAVGAASTGEGGAARGIVIFILAFSPVGPAGDLDGDGLEDVVIAERTDEGELLRAVSGLDGSELWRRSSDADGVLAWPLFTDLTGDGVPDLLRTDLRRRVEFDDDSGGGRFSGWSSSAFRVKARWRIGVVSGATGADVWSLTARSSYTDTETYRRDRLGLRSRWTREIQSTGLARVPSVLDGSHLLFNAIDLDIEETTQRQDPFVSSYRTVSGTTHVQRRDGATGAVLFSDATDPGPSTAILLPVGDRTGDGVQDLLWDRMVHPEYDKRCAWAVAEACLEKHGPPPAHELELLDGATHDSLWTTSAPGQWGYPRQLDADLTGDGAPDLVRFTAGAEQRGEPLAQVGSRDISVRTPLGSVPSTTWPSGYRTALISGHDGSVVWEIDEEEGWPSVVVAEEVGGTPGPDLVLAFTRDDDSMELRRVDGGTGGALFSTFLRAPAPSEDAEDVWALFWATPTDDVSGDGSSEVITQMWIYEIDEDWTVIGRSSTARVESAASGAVHHEESAPISVGLWPVSDVNGDGIADAIRSSSSGDVSTSTVVDLSAPDDLWSRDGVWLSAAGDQDGSPGDEILEVEYFEDGDGRSFVVRSRDGASGALRWQVA